MNILRKRGGRKIICLVAIQLLLNVGGNPILAVEVLSGGKKYSVTTNTKNPQEDKQYEPSSPEETTSGSIPNQALIIGGAVAIGVGAFAIGGGGGGGGSDVPACELNPVGANIAGSDWQGKLRLVNHGSQAVMPTIHQCGEAITIETFTGLPYGKVFVGRITSSGNIFLKDQTTFKIWTTYKGRASATQVRIYDFVNRNSELDSLEISR